MKFVVLLLAVAFCEAGPVRDFLARPTLVEIGVGSFIIGGVNADEGEFPWQLSQQRLGAQWGHSCGASLLGATKCLSAAHCVDGASTTILRVIAGLHDRSNEAGTVIANLARYQMHQQYGQGQPTYNNDIAILHLSSPINEVGWIRYATLPANNNNQYVGDTVVLSGWGRTSASNVLPNILQKVSMSVISETECNQRMSAVNGAFTGPGQICVYTPSVGSCNGDSGGPMNWGVGTGRLVVGVTSWGISSGGVCLQTYPSVYTRTSNYLQWIADN